MEDSRWERHAALGGVVFVVLDVVVAVLGGEPPAADASRSAVAGYFADKGPGIEAGLWLFGLAAMALLATSVLGARTGTLPLWVVAVGGLSALGFVASAVLGATGTDDASSMVGIVGFGLWCVWILGVSFRMWNDPSVGAATGAS